MIPPHLEPVPSSRTALDDAQLESYISDAMAFADDLVVFRELPGNKVTAVFVLLLLRGGYTLEELRQVAGRYFGADGHLALGGRA